MTKQQPPLFFRLCWLPGSKPNSPSGSSMPASERCLRPFLHPPGPLCRAEHLPSSLLWSSLLLGWTLLPLTSFPGAPGGYRARFLPHTTTGVWRPSVCSFLEGSLLLGTHLLPSHLSQCRLPGSARPRPQQMWQESFVPLSHFNMKMLDSWAEGEFFLLFTFSTSIPWIFINSYSSMFGCAVGREVHQRIRRAWLLRDSSQTVTRQSTSALNHGDISWGHQLAGRLFRL